jgi:hypothetical protein
VSFTSLTLAGLRFSIPISRGNKTNDVNAETNIPEKKQIKEFIQTTKRYSA